MKPQFWERVSYGVVPFLFIKVCFKIQSIICYNKCLHEERACPLLWGGMFCKGQQGQIGWEVMCKSSTLLVSCLLPPLVTASGALSPHLAKICLFLRFLMCFLFALLDTKKFKNPVLHRGTHLLSLCSDVLYPPKSSSFWCLLYKNFNMTVSALFDLC